MHKLKNSEVILKFPNLRAYQRNETQDRKVGPGTLRWDPKKGTEGETLKWDTGMGPLLLGWEKLLKTFTNTLNPKSTTET